MNTHWKRLRGLIGRSSFAGAMFFPSTRSVHTLFMRFTIDVAVVDRNLRVIATRQLAPFRLMTAVPTASAVLEAPAGSFEQWALRVGSVIEIAA